MTASLMRKPCTSIWYRVLHSTGSVTISSCCPFNFSLTFMIPVSILLGAAFPAITSPHTHTHIHTPDSNAEYNVIFQHLLWAWIRFSCCKVYLTLASVYMCGYALESPDESIKPPGAGVAGCCEPPDIGTGTTPGSSGRAGHTLNYWAVIPVP